MLEIFDNRKYAKVRDIAWDGPKASEALAKNFDTEEVKEGHEEAKGNEENVSPRKDVSEEPTEVEGFSRSSPAPFIYSAQFNKKNDIIMAGGAGANQVRLFDYESGNVLCVISDLPKAVFCLTQANTSDNFAFGSGDSRLRIMQMRKIKTEE